MVSYKAYMDVFNGWDTHTENWLQGYHFTELFEAVHAWLDSAVGMEGTGGGSLAEELTIVVLSEMGRFPLLNQVGGKDHWTYTSAMLIGSGIQGGQAVGEYDADCRGGKIDLVTGQPDEQGISLVGAHLGATVLQLADIDPAEHLVGFEPISAILT
jgi:uncharacterized protein (DUF1501 family)